MAMFNSKLLVYQAGYSQSIPRGDPGPSHSTCATNLHRLPSSVALLTLALEADAYILYDIIIYQ